MAWGFSTQILPVQAQHLPPAYGSKAIRWQNLTRPERPCSSVQYPCPPAPVGVRVLPRALKSAAQAVASPMPSAARGRPETLSVLAISAIPSRYDCPAMVAAQLTRPLLTPSSPLITVLRRAVRTLDSLVSPEAAHARRTRSAEACERVAKRQPQIVGASAVPSDFKTIKGKAVELGELHPKHQRRGQKSRRIRCLALLNFSCG